jgi:thioester reductase-like protein
MAAIGYLLTGATGVVGSAVLSELLAEGDGPIHLIVRARDDAHLAARGRSLLEFVGATSSRSRSRVVLHRGDVAAQGLGLSPSGRRRVEDEVGRIVHAAGDVHMGRSLADARRSAVGGVERIFDLADRLKAAGRLEKVEIVSTVGVGGVGTTPLRETFGVGGDRFHNTYEQAKSEAEERVYRRVLVGDPVTVHRPSMVVGDSRTGTSIKPQIFASICRVLTGGVPFGVLPRFGEAAIDLVTQDFVARAIVWSSRTRATAGRVLHLCSGAGESILVRELSAAVGIACRRLALSRKTPRLVSPALYRGAVRSLRRAAPKRLRGRLGLLAALLDYLEDPRAFENESTLRSLASASIRLPRHATYVPRVVHAALRPERNREEAPRS